MNTPVSDFDKGLDAGLAQGRLNGRREVINALRKGMPEEMMCKRSDFGSDDAYYNILRHFAWFNRCRDKVLSLLSEIEKNV